MTPGKRRAQWRCRRTTHAAASFGAERVAAAGRCGTRPQFVRSKADEWNIDKTRIGATGGSAGACSSLWPAFHDEMADPNNIAAMEASAPAAWPEFRIGADTRSAHGGETFSAACAYLIRRDPTFFLRRHLSGDRYGLLCGRRAYGWSGQDYRQVLDAVYRYRLLEAKRTAERRKIEVFIAETTKKECLGSEGLRVVETGV